MIKPETVIGNKLQLPTNDSELLPYSIYLAIYLAVLYSNDVANEHARLLNWQKEISLQKFCADVQ